MQVAESISQVRESVKAARRTGQTVGLVPTMGALHAGHLSLVAAATEACDFVVVTIFVNPTQFGPQEDLNSYPRPLEQDLSRCRDAGVDVVFVPSVAEMYPQEQVSWVEVERLTDCLCGQARPSHFRGVTTVCTKLFNIAQADTVFFGQKDAQQALVIQRMVADLNMPGEIRICPTVREEDGLAMSSRNRYLGLEERAQATVLYRALCACRDRILAGQRETATLEAQMAADLQETPLVVLEYATILDVTSLTPVTPLQGTVLIAIAAQVGSARLIDNIVVDVPA